MSRYIDKDKLFQDLNRYALDKYNATIDNIIMKQPECDVTQETDIIYCEDCMWWEREDDDGQGWCSLHQSCSTDGWYCADAKR